MPRNYKYYNPLKFNVNAYSPALWLDAADRSTLIMDGARTFTTASNQYLSCASNSTLTAGDKEWWLAGWFRPTAISSYGLAYKFGSTANQDYRLLTVGNKVRLSSYTTGGSDTAVDSTSSYTANQWNFIVVRNSPTEKKLYLSLNGSAWDEVIYTNTLREGTSDLNISVNGFAFDGRMDSWVYGKSTGGWLDANATALRDYLYNGGSGRRSSDFLTSGWYTGSNPSGAVSWWDMDARSGNESDRIGSNNLTDNGGVGYATGIASGLVQYNGDPITRWQDKSGNARHFTAPSDAARFTYNTAFQNGLSALSSDGVDDILVNTNQLAPLFNGANKEITVFLVGKKPNLTGGHALWLVANETAGSAGNNDLIVGAIGGTTGYPTIQVRLYSGSTTDKTCAGSVAYTANTNFILSAVRTSTTGSVYLNGTLQQSGVDLTQTLAGLYYASIGGRIGGTTPTTDALVASNWYEVIALPIALDNAGITAFHRYLSNKWGIPVS